MIIKTTPNFKNDAKLLGKLHRARLYNLRTQTGHFEHLVVGDIKNFPCTLHNPRIAAINAVHIREYLTEIGFNGCGDSDCSEVGAAPPKCRYLPLKTFSLKPGDDNDTSRIQEFVDTSGRNIGDFRFCMKTVGYYTGLSAG